MLINLISNSLKFTQEGEISLEVDSIINHGVKFLTFKVRDTGVGISQADLGKLFKLFGRLNHNQRMNQSGTGIGLSISKKLVELLGGTIKARSREKKWTEFTFTIKAGKEQIASLQLISKCQSILVIISLNVYRL